MRGWQGGGLRLGPRRPTLNIGRALPAQCWTVAAPAVTVRNLMTEQLRSMCACPCRRRVSAGFARVGVEVTITAR